MVLNKVFTIALVPHFDGAGCTISFAQHQYDDAVLGQFGLVIDGTVLAVAAKMVDQALWRAANHRGLRSAARAKSLCRRSPVAQLTTRRANRSMTTARYSQPPRRDVGDIHTQFLIRTCGSKILIDHIAGDWPMMITDSPDSIEQVRRRAATIGGLPFSQFEHNGKNHRIDQRMYLGSQVAA